MSQDIPFYTVATQGGILLTCHAIATILKIHFPYHPLPAAIFREDQQGNKHTEQEHRHGPRKKSLHY